jgi:hypothetical protein
MSAAVKSLYKPMKQKAVFLTALALCVCFGVMAARAENFIITHAEHECTGSDCLICLQIELASAFMRLARQILTRAAVLCAAAAALFFISRAALYTAPPTGVALHVRLNR